MANRAAMTRRGISAVGRDAPHPKGTARHASDPNPILVLQRTAGNRATTTLLQRTPQADGTITDEAERERLRPIGGAVDVETRVRVLEALLATPRSKAVLDAIAKLRGDIHFPMVWSGRGSYHRKGTIWLDRAGNEKSWLDDTAHEIVHLCTFLAGKAADVQTMGREEFVNEKMADEINAHSSTYVTLLQMGRASSASAAGYNEFVALLKKDHARLLSKKDWAAIEDLAKKFVKKKYEREWVGSKTGKNYYEKWREVWDQAHPDKK